MTPYLDHLRSSDDLITDYEATRAGADEHWKTARAALDRIRDSFAHASCSPHIFFIGSAI